MDYFLFLLLQYLATIPTHEVLAFQAVTNYGAEGGEDDAGEDNADDSTHAEVAYAHAEADTCMEAGSHQDPLLEGDLGLVVEEEGRDIHLRWVNEGIGALADGARRQVVVVGDGMQLLGCRAPLAIAKEVPAVGLEAFPSTASSALVEVQLELISVKAKRSDQICSWTKQDWALRLTSLPCCWNFR